MPQRDPQYRLRHLRNGPLRIATGRHPVDKQDRLRAQLCEGAQFGDGCGAIIDAGR